jgi:hypothetical protein
VTPGDLITTVNLAQVLLQLDPDEQPNEADRLLLQVIEAQPYGELAKKAKDLRGTIASSSGLQILVRLGRASWSKTEITPLLAMQGASRPWARPRGTETKFSKPYICRYTTKHTMSRVGMVAFPSPWILRLELEYH